MNTQERAKLLEFVGIRPLDTTGLTTELRQLRDAWDTEARTYLVLKHPSPSIGTLSLADPVQAANEFASWMPKNEQGEYHEDYRGALFSSTRVYGHPDHTLRVEGFYRRPAGAFRRGTKYALFKVGPYGEQREYRVEAGSDYVERADPPTASSTARLNLESYEAVDLAAMTADDRAIALFAYSRLLARHYEEYEPEKFDTLERIRVGGTNLGLVYNPYDPTYVGLFAERGGVRLSGEQYVAAKQALRELGRMVGDPDASGSDFVDKTHEFLDTEFGPAAGLFGHHMATMWNAKHPSDAVTNCTCGHFELSDLTTSGHRHQTICRRCIDEGRFVYVQDLGTYDRLANAYEHSDDEYYSYPEPDPEDAPDGQIMDYSTDVRQYLLPDKTIKPSAYGEFLMGVELEVVSDYDKAEAASDSLDQLGHDYVITKRDGSLPSGGFEIVTAPRGLQEHLRRFREWAPDSSLTAWDNGQCGMHVHISSQAFTAATLGKFIEFINSRANDRMIRAIAGRHPGIDEQAQDYCQRDGCTPGNPKKTLEDKSSDRYFMVNTTNITSTEANRLGLDRAHADGRPQNTIELRIFRASLKKARLLAQIEFAHAAVMFCRWSSMRELTEPFFMKWLKGMAGVYPNLAKWFGVRANTDVVEERPKARAGAEI